MTEDIINHVDVEEEGSMQTNHLQSEIDGLCSKSVEAGKRDHMQCLIEQVQAYGGEINKVKLKEYSPGNNGMIATEDIKEGDLIAYIPRELMLTDTHQGLESKTMQYIKEHFLV